MLALFPTHDQIFLAQHAVVMLNDPALLMLALDQVGVLCEDFLHHRPDDVFQGLFVDHVARVYQESPGSGPWKLRPIRLPGIVHFDARST